MLRRKGIGLGFAVIFRRLFCRLLFDLLTDRCFQFSIHGGRRGRLPRCERRDLRWVILPQKPLAVAPSCRGLVPGHYCSLGLWWQKTRACNQTLRIRLVWLSDWGGRSLLHLLQNILWRWIKQFSWLGASNFCWGPVIPSLSVHFYHRTTSCSLRSSANCSASCEGSLYLPS